MRYFCHFNRNGLQFKDTRGFQAFDDPEAIEVVRAIARIMFDRDPKAEEGAIQLRSEIGKSILNCSIGSLVSTLH